MTEAEEEAINKKRSNKTAAKFTTRQKTAAVSTITSTTCKAPKCFSPASHDAYLLSADELKFDLQTCGLSLNDQKERYVLSLQ